MHESDFNRIKSELKKAKRDGFSGCSVANPPQELINYFETAGYHILENPPIPHVMCEKFYVVQWDNPDLAPVDSIYPLGMFVGELNQGITV